MPRTSKNRVQTTHDDVRRAILEAATGIYLEKGYAGTSTDDVAALSAVSKRAIYQHFADKDDLIAAVISHAIASAEEQGAQEFDALSETNDLASDLRMFARQHIADVICPHIMRLRRRIIGEVDRFPKLALAWYQAGPSRGHHKLKVCFERLRERGLLVIDDPELAAEQFNWLVLSIPLNQAMFDADAPTDAEKFNYFADEAVRVFLAAYGGTSSAKYPQPKQS